MTDLFSSALITANNELDVKFNTPYGEAWNEILSNVYINYRKEIHSVVNIIRKDLVNIPSSALIPYCTSLLAFSILTKSNDIHSLSYINENLSLDVILGILQPPHQTLIIDAIKDAYVRQSKPYINYGYQVSLAVGKVAEGEFKSYIEFDLSDLIAIKDQAIISIELELTKHTSDTGIVDIYECYTFWHEGFIIWINNIQHSVDPILTFNADKSVIRLNITEFILNLIENKTTFNIMLKSDDFVSFKSRESGFAPRLIIKYADPDWVGFIGEATQYSSAMISNSKSKYFYSIFTILHRNLFNSGAVLRERGLKESESVIKNPLFYNEAFIIANQNSLSSEASIMETSDLVSVFNKNSIEGIGEAIVLKTGNVAGEAYINPGQDINWFNNRVYIIRTFLNALADILDKILYENTAIIQNIDHSNQPSLATVSIPITYMYSNVFIKYQDNKPSIVIIKNEGKKGIVNNAIITKQQNNDYYSSIIVKNREDFLSFVDISGTESLNILSNAIIRTKDNKDIYSNANIISIYNLVSSAIILNSKHENLDSISIVLNKNDKDIYSNSDIYKIFNIPSQAMITKKEALNLFNSAIITIPKDYNIYSETNIRRILDLLSISDLRRITQLSNTAILREFNVSMLYGLAELNGWHPIDNQWFAWIKGINSIKYSNATIRNNARLWIPFTNPNKLPRLWLPENFLNE